MLYTTRALLSSVLSPHGALTAKLPILSSPSWFIVQFSWAFYGNDNVICVTNRNLFPSDAVELIYPARFQLN